LGGLIDESRGQDTPPPSCPRILQTTDVDCEASGAPLVGLRRPAAADRPPRTAVKTHCQVPTTASWQVKASGIALG